jgi:hypothetical protein
MGAARARGGCPRLASGGTRGLAGVGLALLALLAGCAPASGPTPADAATGVKFRPAPGLVVAGWKSGYTGRRMAGC